MYLQELLLAAKWAKHNNLPFPKIDTSEYDKEGFKECYVFHDEDNPKAPIVMHFVLGNKTFKTHSEPGLCKYSANATHSYNLRHCNRAEQSIIHRTKYALKSIQYRTPFVWNSIPDNLKCCETLVSFKTQMKSHFLELQGTEGNVSL